MLMYKRVISLAAAMVLAMSAFAVRFQTDRSWYLAGETMKVSVTAEEVSVCYAELCDMNGLAAGVVIGLKAGAGSGVVELPSNLHSGYYALSVYTRGNANVSTQLVAIVNPLRKSVDDDMEWVESNNTSSLLTVTPELSHWSGVGHPEDTPETEGHIVRARVKNVFNGHAYSRSQIRPSLSIVGKQIHYFEGQMVNDSIALFYTYGVHGRLPIVLSAISPDGVSLPVEIISPFRVLLPKQLPHLVFHYNRSEVEARSIDMQASHLQASTPQGEGAEVGPYDANVLGTKPDLTYNLDEYRQFFKVREVLLEYVNCVRTTKVNGHNQLIVRRGQDHYNISLPTLVLIDGMPVIDTERLLNYDARRVHYINIYGGQYTFGNGVYNGILSFVTRSGRLTNYPVETNMQYLVYGFP